MIDPATPLEESRRYNALCLALDTLSEENRMIFLDLESNEAAWAVSRLAAAMAEASARDGR